MSLISKQDLISIAGLSRLGPLADSVAGLVMSLTKINQINALYDQLKHLRGREFFDAFFQYRNIRYEVFQEDLDRIPKNGAFILVANHPLGAIDGVLMCKILTEIRPDFKVMGNFLLSKIEPMADFVIPVNPFESRKEIFNSGNGIRETLRHLSNGGCLGIFPAGEVSNKNNENNEIRDRDWDSSVMKLIKKAGVPVIPMYFHTSNRSFFYKVSKVHPDLQTLMLPAEMMADREKPIKIRIGKPISQKVMSEYETPEDLAIYLRQKVYIMKSYYEKRKKITEYLKLPNLGILKPRGDENYAENIIDETPQDNLITEIENLRKIEGKSLFVNGDYEVFFAKYDDIPNIMREIGRQREITFRGVGEGTNLPFDLDHYDRHYHHLFLWDRKTKKLVGAYRMALGAEVMKKYGIDGFYTSSLFEFDPELQPFFRKVIEMGRAYISIEYQQKPLPLFLLWRGIIHVCLRNPEHKFLMGGVSISNQFSDFSKALMIQFMRSHYYDAAVAQYVHPKYEFKVKIRERDQSNIFFGMDSDMNKLDKLIDDLEPNLRLPVLLKKYVKQNARVISFNVDPNFNDAIDGLMYIRISELPEDTVRPVLEELSVQLKSHKR